MIDQNLNDARSFLVSIIEDPKSDQRSIELSFKIILLLGLVRSNVEDFLLVATLLDQQKGQVDLRAELELLKQEHQGSGESHQAKSFTLSGRKQNKRGTVFYLKAGDSAQNVKNKASFACDG